jgi:hypothetical protein
MRALLAIGALLAAGAAVAQSAETKVGNWTVKKTVDGFSDEKRGIAHTSIETKTGTLAVKCDKPGKDSLYVTVLTADYLGSSSTSRYSSTSGKYRFDDQPPADLVRPSYDGRSAHLFATSAGRFITELLAANPKRLRIQFVTYDSNFANADIDVTGAADALRQTAAICVDTRLG